jgi:ABC-type multidrug transport system ATPase subunit
MVANGAGKTTLMACLTGWLEPSSGSAVYYPARNGGLNVARDISDIQQTIGICPQFDVLYPALSAREHLTFFAMLKGVDPTTRSRHISNILKAIGLSSMSDKRAKDLSGGMRRRLSMGIALLGEPAVLFLDEPSTGLDPLTRRTIWKIFAGIRRDRERAGNPLTVILTTHQLDEADSLCCRIGIMRQGRLRCLGSPHQLKSTLNRGYAFKLSLQRVDTIAEHDLETDVEKLARSGLSVKLFEGTNRAQIQLPNSCSNEVFTGVLRYLDTLQMQRTVVSIETRAFVVSAWGLQATTLDDVFSHILTQ